jgi:hypothetical protein
MDALQSPAVVYWRGDDSLAARPYRVQAAI